MKIFTHLNNISSDIFLALIAALVLLSGCQKSSKRAAAPPSVKAAIVEERDVPIYLDAIGQVISPEEVQVRPQVQGKLLEAFIHQGAIVKKGDVLYTIDPRPYQAALDQAKGQLMHDLALLDIAEKTMTRYKQVIEDDFISKLAFEQYESNVKAADALVESDLANVKAAELNVEFCKIVAPISGKISYFNIYPGNIVAAYDPNFITVIRPFDPIDIQFSLPQNQFEAVRKELGNEGLWPFIAILPENIQTKIAGVTYFIDNQLNQNTGTILLKGRCSNEELAFWPGEFVKVKVLQRNVPSALVVPLGSVLIGKDGPYVYTIDAENNASFHNVTVLTRTDEYIAIESTELKKDDLVVVDGQINIAPGVKVIPVPGSGINPSLNSKTMGP